MKTEKPKENAKPLKVLAAKIIPRKLENPGKAVIEDLIKKGVLQ